MEPNLEWLLNYEVRMSKRYRRHLCMVLVVSGDTLSGGLQILLQESFRDCDVLLQVNGYIAIVMSETAREGGLRAIERCRRQLEPVNAAFSLVTFPADGVLTPVLLDRAQSRLMRACRGESAGVVIQD